jgi:fatty acid desaturase
MTPVHGQGGRRRWAQGLWLTVSGVLHAGTIVGAVWAWGHGWWPITAVCWIASAWLNHAALTQMHEAGHGTLWRHRAANELHGILVGTLSLTPLSVYRYVHARHHAHLGRERDPEFWPYNLPATPRWIRVLYAWTELTVGWLFTPLLYSVRTALSWRHVSRGQRRRIVLEWLLLALFWPVVLLVVIAQGWIEPFLVGWLAPVWIAGSAQTLRKFTEHLGMHGESVLAMTRTVAYRHAAGRAASRSQRHVDHHGTHHRYARIPFYDLPRVTETAYGAAPDARLYRSHLAALLDMLPSLLDPRVGPQWTGRP